MSETKEQMPAEVAAKYDLQVIPARRNVLPVKFGREEIDFGKITLEKADELFEKYGKEEGFYLKLKKGAGKPKEN